MVATRLTCDWSGTNCVRHFVISTFFVPGQIKKINISSPRDSCKSESAVILLQYRAQRESANGPVDFVNAVMIRIPDIQFQKLRDKLVVGQHIHVHGHLQGALKNGVAGFYVTELVADRIHIEADLALAA